MRKTISHNAAILRLISRIFYTRGNSLPVSRDATAAVMVTTKLATELAARFAGLDLFERLALVAAKVPGRIVFTTSLGLEDQAITHAIFVQDLGIEVVTLDTGRLFAETHQVWADTEGRYDRRIHGLFPDHSRVEQLVARQGTDGFRASVEARRACCAVRKVEPLGRALDGAAGWITGLRAEQSADRALLDFVAVDEAYGVIKANPLFDWPRERVVEFVRRHDVPYNPLHDRGFLSIGCAPCTRAVRPGEPERAGRWWWEQDKKECGLHHAPRARTAASTSKLERV
jgi:phosphoadenosine phosphosulfate reductase